MLSRGAANHQTWPSCRSCARWTARPSRTRSSSSSSRLCKPELSQATRPLPKHRSPRCWTTSIVKPEASWISSNVRQSRKLYFFFKVILAASSSPLPAQLPAMTETPPPPPPAVLSTPIKPWSLAVNWRPCPLGTVWKEGGGFTVNLDLPTTLPTRPRRPLARFTLDSSSLANPSLLRWHVGAQFQQQKQPQPSSELSSSASQPAAAAAAAPGATVPSPPPQQQQPQTPKSERRGSGSGSSSSSNVDVKRVRLW